MCFYNLVWCLSGPTCSPRGDTWWKVPIESEYGIECVLGGCAWSTLGLPIWHVNGNAVQPPAGLEPDTNACLQHPDGQGNDFGSTDILCHCATGLVRCINNGLVPALKGVFLRLEPPRFFQLFCLLSIHRIFCCSKFGPRILLLLLLAPLSGLWLVRRTRFE